MDNQLSRDGDKNGLFTGTLKKVWNAGKFKLVKKISEKREGSFFVESGAFGMSSLPQMAPYRCACSRNAASCVKMPI
jgi:hypothetical protein